MSSRLVTPQAAAEQVARKVVRRWADAICAEHGLDEPFHVAVPLSPGAANGTQVATWGFDLRYDWTGSWREVSSFAIPGIEDAWCDRAVAAAKVRFLEDYADESLWEDHQKTLKIQVPFAWRGPTEPKRYTGTRAALEHLVDRLVEDGTPPYGLTVAEAVATLDEELVTHAGHEWRGDGGGKVVAIAQDVLELRFPDGPPVAGLLETD